MGLNKLSNLEIIYIFLDEYQNICYKQVSSFVEVSASDETCGYENSTKQWLLLDAINTQI